MQGHQCYAMTTYSANKADLVEVDVQVVADFVDGLFLILGFAFQSSILVFVAGCI